MLQFNLKNIECVDMIKHDYNKCHLNSIQIMNVFMRAMVNIFSPHENIFIIALINIHYLYNITPG